MPLIPFPYIPPLPGVPAIPRSILYPAKLPTRVVAKPVTSVIGVQWGFVGADGGAVLSPDSFIDFEYREERKIPNYPIEGGGFQSYNKVAMPFDCRITVSCNGKGKMTKENFLNAIDTLMNSLTLINVITPNFTYKNCNLVHVDYRREAKQGVSLIIAQLWFQQVRIAQVVAPATTAPSGASPQYNGQVAPNFATPKQQSHITADQSKIDFMSTRFWRGK